MRLPLLNDVQDNTKLFNGPVVTQKLWEHTPEYNIMYVDGDGDGKICVFVDKTPIRVYGRVTVRTPPESEYYSMMAGISYINYYDLDKWIILSDNQMVVGQLCLDWNIGRHRFSRINKEICRFIRNGNLDVKIGWVKGRFNKASTYLKSVEFDHIPDYSFDDILYGNLYIT